MLSFFESMTRVMGLACLAIAMTASSQLAFANGPRQPGVIGKPVPVAKCDSCACGKKDAGKQCPTGGCTHCGCQKSGLMTFCH
jgi:hypothetical protein